MKECIDIGIIQAFLDGETSAGETVRISEHIEDCDPCALLLAQAEDESAIVFSALDRDLDALVPTQRLWSRINELISEERERASWWHRALAMLSLPLSSPSMAAAGVLVVVGMLAVVWSVRSVSDFNDPSGFVADAGRPSVQVAAPAPPAATSPGQPAKTTAADTEVAPTTGRVPTAERANNASSAERKGTERAGRPRAMNLQYIPGEETYMRTIADLKESVDVQKDRVLPPASRIAFERDLAVVNDNIDRMQKVVRRNPNNQSAKQLLYSSYQDKIDLLNSVAQRDELMASLR